MFSSVEFGRPYVFPPDVPPDRVEAHAQGVRRRRDAIPKCWRRPSKIKMDMTFHSPEQLERLVAALYATPPDLIETVKKLVPNLQ